MADETLCQMIRWPYEGILVMELVENQTTAMPTTVLFVWFQATGMSGGWRDIRWSENDLTP
jgi:hypothetical protein